MQVRTLLSRESARAVGQLFGLLGELPLVGRRLRPCCAAAGAAALPLGLLLLALGQLLQLLGQLVDLVVGLLLLRALAGLVLVLQLVQLELEEVGQVFRFIALAAAFAFATACSPGPRTPPPPSAGLGAPSAPT